MRELELKVGEVHELVLRGLGTAGYTWEIEPAGPDGVLEVQRASSGPAASAPLAGPPPPGGSLPEVFHLVAVGAGRVQLRLALRRSWEADSPPVEEDELDVTVSA